MAIMHREPGKQIVRLLERFKSSEFTVLEIADQLGLNRHTTTTLLSRLARSGRIERVDRGTYRALLQDLPEGDVAGVSVRRSGVPGLRGPDAGTEKA